MSFIQSFLALKNRSTFIGFIHALFVFLLAILPFHVLLSVWAEHVLHIPGFALYKEGILILLSFSYLLGIKQGVLKCRFDFLDALIGLYIGSLLAITFWNGLSIEHIFYGGRYDFEFLLAFFLARKFTPILPLPLSKYLRIFLISASIALVLGILIRFVIGETILLHFGFSANLSNWMFGGSIPIYHGIDGANVRRFQGIFDGPNPAGFFILLYLGVLAFYNREKKPYHFLLACWGIVLVGVLFFTYSRSAVIGLVAGFLCFFILSFGSIWKRHRKVLLMILPVFLILSGLFYLKFETTFKSILLREGSTKGHFSRMITGIKRFSAHPMGNGLATSGPAYRYVTPLEMDEGLFQGENKTLEDYSIPESWYVQQLVEGGIIGFALFLGIMGRIFLLLVQKNRFIASSFFAMLTMNLFLHSFESAYISLLLFIIIGIIVAYEGKKRPTI